MFYCDICAKQNDFPITIGKSNGTCEICKRIALCNDMPISKLPVKEKTFIDDILSRSELIQEEMHKFIERMREEEKTRKRKTKIPRQDLVVVYFTMKIAELEKRIEDTIGIKLS